MIYNNNPLRTQSSPNPPGTKLTNEAHAIVKLLVLAYPHITATTCSTHYKDIAMLN